MPACFGQAACSPMLNTLKWQDVQIQGYEDLVATRLADSPDLTSFLLELSSLLERLLRFRRAAEAACRPTPSCSTLSQRHAAWTARMHADICSPGQRLASVVSCDVVQATLPCTMQQWLPLPGQAATGAAPQRVLRGDPG